MVAYYYWILSFSSTTFQHFFSVFNFNFQHERCCSIKCQFKIAIFTKSSFTCISQEMRYIFLSWTNEKNEIVIIYTVLCFIFHSLVNSIFSPYFSAWSLLPNYLHTIKMFSCDFIWLQLRLIFFAFRKLFTWSSDFNLFVVFWICLWTIWRSFILDVHMRYV